MVPRDVCKALRSKRPVSGRWSAMGYGVAEQIAIYLVALAVWQLLSSLMGEFLMPSPAATGQALVEILSRPTLVVHVLVTLWRTVLGVLVAALSSLVVVVLARHVYVMRRAFLLMLYPLCRAASPVAVALMALVWFDLGTAAVVAVVVMMVLPIYMINIWEKLKVLDVTVVEMGRAICKREQLIFTKITFPMLMPTLFSSTKLAFALAYKIALVGEFMAASDGMGYGLYMALQAYHMHLVFGWTFIVIAFVVFFELYLFNLIEKRLLYRWVTET